MSRYHVACCRTEYGLYFLDAPDEIHAKALAKEKLRTGEEFDALITTEVGIGEIKNIDEMDILEPAGYDEDIGELVHIPREGGT